MTVAAVRPARTPAGLAVAAALAAVGFLVVAVLLLVVATGLLQGAAQDGLGAVLLYDVLTVVAAVPALQLALRVTRRSPEAALAGDLDRTRGRALLAVGLVPALVYLAAALSSGGAGPLRLPLVLLALAGTGCGVVLREQALSRG